MNRACKKERRSCNCDGQKSFHKTDFSQTRLCYHTLTRAGNDNYRADASELLQDVEYQHAMRVARVGGGSSSKVMGRGMIGKGMTDMTLVLFPRQTFPCPFFSLVSGRSQILHFVAVRVKLDASTLTLIICGEDFWVRRPSQSLASPILYFVFIIFIFFNLY
jgi:hypothetical protein